MKPIALLLLLAGCGAPFQAAGPDLLERADGAPDAQTDGGASEPDGGGEQDGRADAGEAQVEAAAEAAVDGMAEACAPDFPDGGFMCGTSWVNAPNYYLCVTKSDGGQTTVGPSAAFCGACATCSTCHGQAVCATLGQSFVSCSDTGGELRVLCD